MAPNSLIEQASIDSLAAVKLFDVTGWVTVVTGGGTGLGLVTAAALAKNGALVYITGRRKEPLDEAIERYGAQVGPGKLVAVQGDVSTKQGIEELKAMITEKHGYLNLLINNHGVAQRTSGNIQHCDQTPEGIGREMYESEEIQDWLDCYRINTASYYFISAALLPLLAKGKIGDRSVPGMILNISSVSGLTKTAQMGQFNYNCTKSACKHLTEMLATEFAQRGTGVRVNAICPGLFPSGMSVHHFDQVGKEAEHHWRVDYGIPFARAGNAVDYAQTVMGIVTNEWMTGNFTVIDGGWMSKENLPRDDLKGQPGVVKTSK